MKGECSFASEYDWATWTTWTTWTTRRDWQGCNSLAVAIAAAFRQLGKARASWRELWVIARTVRGPLPPSTAGLKA